MEASLRSRHHFCRSLAYAPIHARVKQIAISNSNTDKREEKRAGHLVVVLLCLGVMALTPPVSWATSALHSPATI